MEDRRIILSPLGGGLYTVVEDYGVIPAGFATDGASIPRLLWRLLGHPFQSDYIEVFVRHDYRYQTGSLSRKEADKEMLDGLKRAGMGWLKRYTIYWGVRIGGGSHYNKMEG